MTWTRMKLALLSGGLAVAGISCDSQPVADVPDDRTGESAIPAPGDARTRAPSPDAARLSFDESTQVLQLYDLPEQGGYWMVALPAEPRGVPMQGDFKFTKRADPKAVSIYYTLPKGGTSNAVTLQEIVDAKKPVVH